MKKAFLKLMVLVLGLNVFTACYGPALPYPDGNDELEGTEQTDGTKADVEEEADEAEASETPEKA